MMGHPGFSAMEYAGSTGGEGKNTGVGEGGSKRRRFGREAASPKTLEHEEEDLRVPDSESTEQGVSLQSVEGPTSYQRRRGTFMNHTPRDFEKAPPRRTEAPQTLYNDSIHTSESSNQLPMLFTDSNTIERQREKQRHRSYSSGCTGVVSNRAHSTTNSRVASKATSTKGSVNHSPLEPLVAQLRREVTGSDVDTLPPYVDVDNVSQTSALFAVQEYFKSLEVLETATQIGENGQSEATPSLPDRNPERLQCPSSPFHAYSGSTQSDFTSAARGQYSPYGRQHASPLTSSQARDIHELNGGRTPSESDHVLTAPPIPSHEELTARRPLNDLNYFLRNTGPSDKMPPEKKEKKAFVFGKARNKKTLAAKFGSVEGSPTKGVEAPTPFRPTCAKEMTTSRGAKHLQIIVPATNLSSNSVLTLPVIDSKGISKRVSVSFTEEMLNPLASSKVEIAIAGSSSNGSGNGTTQSSPVSTRTVIRTPKRPPISPKAVPVVDHPLMVTREEQTRQRKLRDLQQSKKRLYVTPPEDTAAGAPPTPVDFKPTSSNESLHAGCEGDEEEMERERIAKLERLANELSRELATAVGIDLSEGAFDPEEVLRMARTHEAKTCD